MSGLVKIQKTASGPLSERLSHLKITSRIALGMLSLLALLICAGGLSYKSVLIIGSSFEDYSERSTVETIISSVDHDFLTYRRLVREFYFTGRNDAEKAALDIQAALTKALGKAVLELRAPDYLAKMRSIDDTFQKYAADFGKLSALRKARNESVTEGMDSIMSDMVQTKNQLVRSGLHNDKSVEPEQFNKLGEILGGVRLSYTRSVERHDVDVNTRGESLLESMTDLLAELKPQLGAENQALVVTLIKNTEDYKAAAAKTTDIDAQIVALVETGMTPLAEQISLTSEAILDSARQEQQNIAITTQQLIATIEHWIMIFAAGSGLIAILMAWGIGRSVSIPLKKITNTMTTLARGNMDVPIPALNSRNEIGEIARAVAVFRDAGVEKIRMEQLSMVERAQAEQDRSTRETNELHTSEIARHAIRDLGIAIGRLAAGDIGYQIPHKFEGSFDQLRVDLNESMLKLQDTVRSVADASQTIHASTQDMRSASNNLSHRTEHQAATLEEISASIKQISDTVRKTSTGADRARQVVMKTSEQAVKSGQVIDQSITAMQGISESSNRVTFVLHIADGTREQSESLHQIRTAIGELDQATQQNSVMVQETTDAAHSLSEEAEHLKQLISQ
eukprot:gene9495-9575_t